MRREIPLDAGRILAVLAEHRVDYVMIGGLAVQAHGHVRTTQGADLLPDPDPENLERLAVALTTLGARPAGKAAGTRLRLDGRSIASARTLSLDTDAGGVDVHLAPPGAAPYDAMRGRALVLNVFDVEVAVPGLDDLISMKRAAGRPVDIGDIAALTQSAE